MYLWYVSPGFPACRSIVITNPLISCHSAHFLLDIRVDSHILSLVLFLICRSEQQGNVYEH